MHKNLIVCCFLLLSTNVFGQLFTDMAAPLKVNAKAFNIDAYTGFGVFTFAYDSNLPPDPNSYLDELKGSLYGIPFPSIGVNIVSGNSQVRAGGSFESTTLRSFKSAINNEKLRMTMLRFAARGEYSFTYGRKGSFGGILQLGSAIPINPLGTFNGPPIYANLGIFVRAKMSTKIQFYFETGIDAYWFSTMLRGKKSNQNISIALSKIGISFGK